MRKSNPVKPIIFLLFLFSMASLNACYERVEGCTDLDAANFNALADDHCCCTYPEISFQYQHRFGGEDVRFSRDSIYQLEGGGAFSLIQLDLIAGDFFLQRSSGEKVRVENRLDFPSEVDSDCPCIDDVFVINPARLSGAPGEIAQPGDYVSLGFTAGVPNQWAGIEPEHFPANHALSDLQRYDTLNQRYYDLRAQFVLHDLGTDTIRFATSDFTADIEFSESVELPRGQNKNFRLEIDYKKWFNGIEAVYTNQEAVNELLKNNLQEAVRLRDD